MLRCGAVFATQRITGLGRANGDYAVHPRFRTDLNTDNVARGLRARMRTGKTWRADGWMNGSFSGGGGRTAWAARCMQPVRWAWEESCAGEADSQHDMR